MIQIIKKNITGWKYIISLGILWAVLSIIYIEKQKELSSAKTNTGISEQTTIPKNKLLSVSADDASNVPKLRPSTGFNFPKNKFLHTVPLAENLAENLMVLKLAMVANATQRLTLIGKYYDTEQNRTMFADLGLARANNVKNRLINMGFLSEQIRIKSSNTTEQAPPDQILSTMVDFSIETLSADEIKKEQKNITLLTAQIKKDPLVLRFDLEVAEISMTQPQRQKIFDIINIVDHKKKLMITVTGHTDSSGAEASNYKLGVKRANFAKQFLVDNGLAVNKIRTVSLGSTKPLNTNTTLEERIVNRRTVITVE